MRAWPLALIAAACAPDAADSVVSTAQDADGDGFLELVDCDDQDPTAYPDAPEVCDGVDNNCDGRIDDADPAVDASTGGTWHRDDDGDGYGDPDATVTACEQPAGSSDDASDCDDSSPRVSPVADEVCGDDIDQDCDGADLRCAPQGVLSVSGADATLTGGAASEAGAALAGGLDLDGDGVSDFLVGAPRVANGGAADAGGVAFFLGAPAGAATLGDVSHAWIPGAASGDQLGASLASGADASAAFALLGSPGSGAGGSGSGAVAVLLADDGVPGSIGSLRTLVAGPADALGYAVAVSPDVTGDDAADGLLGAIADATAGFAAGAAWVAPDLAGIAGGAVGDEGLHLTGQPGDAAGWSVSAAGDIDGDGVGDLLVGAPGRRDRGAAFVVSGPVTGDAALDDRGVRIDGAGAGYRLGEAVLGGADLTGDGYDDVLLGDPAYIGDRGGAWLLPGPIGPGASTDDAVATFEGRDGDGLGHHLNLVGDLDADGLSDLGVSGDKTDQAWIFYGPLSGARGPSGADGRVSGSAGARIGGAMAGAGDIDQDGFDDLLVSDPEIASTFLFYGGRR